MNVGDPCRTCGENTWSYKSTTLTCKKGHHTSVDSPAPVSVRVAARRNIPAAVWAVAGAALVLIGDRL